ncbi:hypothetical protein CDV31_001898 [Fusarium ambrosium]|uniref:Rhodopsin domain-containing protein n=1 Tax=Fusarium ambrosium TaxID=131363 RepID=A0A428UY81_9HYPO|nr:hypothetical protein CDV31_001898 [Fusarium ambrosium]
MPMVQGVPTVLEPPKDYVVDFENPRRQGVPEAYYVSGFGMALSFLFIAEIIRQVLSYRRSTSRRCASHLFICVATIALCLHMFATGVGGVHAWEISVTQFNAYLMDVYFGAFIYILCGSLSKLALLVFYLRLSPQRWFRIATWSTIVFIGGYTVGIFFACIFSCKPIAMSWDVTITDGVCINRPSLYIATAVANIISDVILFFLPIPMVIKLQIPPRQKIGLVIIFGIGSLTVVTSVVRVSILPALLTDPDATWVIAWASSFATIHLILRAPEPGPEQPRFLSRFRRNSKKPAPTPQDILTKSDNPQSGSPLFKLLPAEVRNQIFALSLTDYEDPSPHKHYAGDTCFTRPSYFAPRKTDTALLRTCRAIYRECRFLPFMLTEQLHWLSFDVRAPPEYDVDNAVEKLHATAKEMAQQMGQERVQIEGIRVFPQTFKLEGGELERLLGTPYMDPKKLTITIRHADWWDWEDDAPLRFEGSWISDVSEEISPSLNEICIEMETLERKKRQVDRIAKMMIDRWFFKKPDGTVLVADTEGSTRQESRWKGTSRWHDKRWVRDETEEGVIDYYIVSVTFRPRHIIERNGGKISKLVSKRAETNDYDDDELSLRLPDETAMDFPRPIKLSSPASVCFMVMAI